MKRSRLILATLVVAMMGVMIAAPANASGRHPTVSGATVRHINIRYFSYYPNWMQVTPDQEIDITNFDWVNRGIPHTMTSNDGVSFDTGVLFGDTYALFAPTTPGRYRFHCDIHPSMHGTLVVSGT